jgi:hypothetical protein
MRVPPQQSIDNDGECWKTSCGKADQQRFSCLGGQIPNLLQGADADFTACYTRFNII